MAQQNGGVGIGVCGKYWVEAGKHLDKLIVGQVRVAGVGMWWCGLGMGK